MVFNTFTDWNLNKRVNYDNRAVKYDATDLWQKPQIDGFRNNLVVLF